ncbi:MAG: hypothetical protein QOG91_645 [Candidatus Parcubacteria bacterium]|jgi:glycosyltransferase involved in cell wall biosynthesis|nr:hypothetical protein [Candidatus Parcubacteria bacterium]
MKVSVIIPAHNEEKTIAAAIAAVLDSDYPDFEVIVVNNASSDRTVEAAAAFPVRIEHEGRKGTMWACECGRRAATGDIIVRMDADCLPERMWLRRATELFQDDGVVAASGPYDYYDVSPFFRRFSLFVQLYVYRPLHSALQFLGIGGIMMGGNSFFRARTLESIGGFNTDIVFFGDDTDAAKRMSAAGRVVYGRDIVIRTSGRRFKAKGTARTLIAYIFHFFKVTFKA